MKMKVTLVVKDKDNNIVHSEDFIINNKGEIPEVSDKVAKRMVELENKYPHPEYEVEQNLSLVSIE